jgi:hypothetical protein
MSHILQPLDANTGHMVRTWWTRKLNFSRRPKKGDEWKIIRRRLEALRARNYSLRGGKGSSSSPEHWANFTQLGTPIDIVLSHHAFRHSRASIRSSPRAFRSGGISRSHAHGVVGQAKVSRAHCRKLERCCPRMVRGDAIKSLSARFLDLTRSP